jgi:dienelactone hydrolase
MDGIARFVGLAVGVSLSVGLVACGDDDDEQSVTSEVVSDPMSPDLRVLAPEGGGPWPVAFALHGIGGTGEDMVELGTRLAEEGVVVFVPTYSSDLDTPEGLEQASDDIVCAYQAARRAAPDHGGDLDRPITAVGWSLGADFAVLGGLGPPSDDSGGRCPGALPEPEVIVGVAGCYYEFDGNPVTWFDDLTGWSNKGAGVHLIDGEDDRTCPAWQTEQLADALDAEGYDVEVTQLASADHPAPIFHTEQDGRWEVDPDNPAGEEVVEIVVDAIATAEDGAPG